MNFLEDPLTRQTIPMDLVIEIFSRLPAKSAARCLCLSKFWASIISSQYFVDLFSAKSSARPQILFGRRNNPKFSFFSADQPSKNSFDNIAPIHVTDYPISNNYCVLGVPINGLLCLSEYVGKIRVPVIHNPTTREFLTLPKMKTKLKRQNIFIRNFLGYDPNEKQFKVLSIVSDSMERGINNVSVEYQVLTLETEALSWRMIECCTPDIIPFHQREICINGILYYQAFGISMVHLIVCFDVRSETFKFINVMETSNKNLPWTSVLTNYNWKLGLLIPEESRPILGRESRSFELWVLKDAEKQEWSKHIFVLPPVWKNVVKETELKFVGMIGTNKIVLSSFNIFQSTNETPCILFYNIRKETIRRINIQGMEASTHIYHYVFLNHVENLMSLLKFLK